MQQLGLATDDEQQPKRGLLTPLTRRQVAGTLAALLTGLATIGYAIAGDWAGQLVISVRMVPEIRESNVRQDAELRALEKRVDEQDRKVDRIDRNVQFLVERQLRLVEREQRNGERR